MAADSVKFTPAPWKYNPKTSQVYASSQICKIWQFGNGEGKANAALITAAPELYEALILCTGYIHNGYIKSEDKEFIEKALVKARGEVIPSLSGHIPRLGGE